MTDLLAQKTMPHSEEAERSVLGAVLVSQGPALDDVPDLRPEHFYREAHRTILQVMVEMHGQNRSCDLVTVTDEIERRGLLEQCGGPTYVSGLFDGVPSARNIRAHAEIVKDRARRRDLIAMGVRIQAEALSDSDPTDAIARRADADLIRIAADAAGRQHERGPVRIGDSLPQTIERLEQIEAARKEGKIVGIRTGIADLDQLLLGLEKPGTSILAGLTSMGKTQAALQVAETAARDGIPVLICSQEMVRWRLEARLLCKDSAVSQRKATSGWLGRQDWAAMTDAFERLRCLPIWIDERPAMTLAALRATVRWLKRKVEDLGLLIFDYLQLADVEQSSNENRNLAVARYSGGIQRLAKDEDMHAMALSQLSRPGKNMPRNWRPQLQYLRDSGAIEQDFDTVLFVHRPSLLNPDKRGDEWSTCYFDVAKRRNGAVGSVRVQFHGPTGRYLPEAKHDDRQREPGEDEEEQLRWVRQDEPPGVKSWMPYKDDDDEELPI